MQMLYALARRLKKSYNNYIPQRFKCPTTPFTAFTEPWYNGVCAQQVPHVSAPPSRMRIVPHLCKTPEICPSQTSKKSWIARRAPIRQISERQKQINSLSRLLKRAALLRDGFQCVRCGKPQTQHPIHPYDFLDVLHTCVKSTWPLAHFLLPNVKILCRKCHESIPLILILCSTVLYR
jgi:5-methylcytosine-specific restriction endonuclease McrA